jgi:hypothetical protein
MGNIERRVARLEEQQGACNHHPVVILANPTDEVVMQKRQEIDRCPSCRRRERPRMVIIHYPELSW